MNDNGRELPPALTDEASVWFARMRGEDAEKWRTEFELWLAQSDAHRHAYADIASVFGTSSILKTSTDPVVAGKGKRRGLWIGGLGLAAAAAALLAVGLGYARGLSDAAGGTAPLVAASDLATGAGEIRTFALIDGSRLTLDSDSRAAVRFDDHRRRLDLVAGRARVAVASDPRPFALELASATVVTHRAVVDAAFVADGEVMVELISGEAGFSATPRRSAVLFTMDPLPLDAARPMTTARGSFAPRPAALAGTARQRDWPDGWAEYRSITLGALVAEANRYAVQPIVVDDPAVAAIAVSGRFRLTDTDGFVRRVALMLDLEARRRSSGYHLSRK